MKIFQIKTLLNHLKMILIQLIIITVDNRDNFINDNEINIPGRILKLMITLLKILEYHL